MLNKFDILLKSDKSFNNSFDLAFALYAVICEAASPSMAERLHDEKTLFSQYVTSGSCNEFLWHIGYGGGGELFEILSGLDKIQLHKFGLTLEISEITAKVAVTPKKLIDTITDTPQKIKFDFLTPCSFKQNGRYTVLPTLKLIFGSLLRQYSAFFGEELKITADEIADLCDISSYTLTSDTLSFKKQKFPGFRGNITIKPKPDIAKNVALLALFAEYCGIGIKRKDGMGGVSVKIIY
jgi:CRISPR-associated endoribonuclease Cas6